MGARKPTEQGPVVDLRAPCRVCRGTGVSADNDMLFCDGCDDCYHVLCVKVARVPNGHWFCRACAPAFKRARPEEAPGPTVDPTYVNARTSRGDKKEKRAKAGLHPGLLTTWEEVARLEAAALADSTRKKIDGLSRSLDRFLASQPGQLVRGTPGAFELFVTWRVKSGVGRDTILSEMSLMRHVPGARIPDVERVSKLAKAVKRMADCSDEAKDPITLREMRLLKTQVLEGWKDSGSLRDRLALRNWSYFLVGFTGMFRANELLAMRWEDINFGWTSREGETELAPGETPESGVLRFVSLHVRESKTSARGQTVRISAAPQGGDWTDCPARLTQRLHQERRGRFVFAELRTQYSPEALSDDTMRSLFKKALRGAGLNEQRLAKLSLHSLRRGGATAAAASGATMREIKAQGRWRSDVAYIYALVSDQTCVKLTERLLTALQDLE